jgi:dihydrofolate synthase/folylpolyglutamate synthase
MPPPTFFEIGTALGFLHFAQRKCDLAIIEVGLGGRFDSTNVCTPLVSVITNVGFDHMAQLGNTLEAIAYEKAGIIKRGVPVISGVTQSGPREVVARVAMELDAPLWDAKDFLPQPELAVGLLGTHQRENAACAIGAIERLREAGISVPAAAVRDGLASVRWPARIEVRSRRPLVILDTAHNVPSAEALVQTLAECFPDAGRKAVVFAVSSDKQSPEIIRILASYFDSFHMTRYGDNPRATPPEKLAETLRQIDGTKECRRYAASKDAWAAAQAALADNDLLCATGSMFLAGELLGGY